MSKKCEFIEAKINVKVQGKCIIAVTRHQVQYLVEFPTIFVPKIHILLLLLFSMMLSVLEVLTDNWIVFKKLFRFNTETRD